jgi:hypothetical protein
MDKNIYQMIFQGCVWRREAAENHLDRLSASTYSARTVAASTYLTTGKIRDRRTFMTDICSLCLYVTVLFI